MPLPNIKLKTELLKRGVTQRAVGFVLGIPEEKLSKIVRGYLRPTLSESRAIIDFLGLPEAELFTEIREGL
jgi:transcriptional regulator with XRE-family HTH domain